MWTIFKVLLNFFNKETELLLFCVLVSWPQGMWDLSFPTRGWTSTTCPGGFPGGTGGQESSCQCRRHKRCNLIPGLGRSPDKGMATHSSILAWSIPWTEEPGRLQSMESQELGMTEWHVCMRAHARSHTHTHTHTHREASLVAQTVNNPAAMQDTWVWTLGWEDPLEEGMATHSSVLAWRIPWTEEPGGL